MNQTSKKSEDTKKSKKSEDTKKSKTLKTKPPCKEGKVRNANGRCVNMNQTSKKSEDTKKSEKLKTKSPSKEGKVRSEISILEEEKIPEEEIIPEEIVDKKSIKLKNPCKEGKVRNANGRCVNMNQTSKKSEDTKKSKPKSPSRFRKFISIFKKKK
jgi:hypothetical protein